MIKVLMKSIREYKKASILTPVFVGIEVVLECLIPFITADLIDYFQGTISGQHVFALFNFDIATASAMDIVYILIYAAILIGMASLALVFGVLSGKSCATASTGFAKNLRKDVFYNIQNFSFENIDKYSTSSLVTRLTTDITNIQMAFMMIIRIAVRSPLMFMFSVAMSFTINWALALIFVTTIPILAATLLFLMFKVLPIFRRVFKKYDRMNLRVQENLHGIRVVKAYVRQNYEIEKFDKAAEEIRGDFTRAERMMALMSPVMNFVLFVVMLLICAFGAIIIVNTNNGMLTGQWYGTLSTGTLTSMMSYTIQSLMSLMMFAMVAVMVSMAVESARRVTEVIKEVGTLASPKYGISEVPNGSIEFNNVDFSYSGEANNLALSEINLKIESGMTVGIIGATGSSKTTLVQLVPRLYDVLHGEVRVGGINVKDYDLEALRRSVAMVLQKNVLFSGTIKENLRWGNQDASDEQLIEACKLAQADDFIRQFPDGYDTYIEQSGTNVSGGQRQRLCIARALLAKPKIVIFDDSTSAVDTKTDALIRNAMTKNIAGTTKIIIAQRIDSVKDSDMIIVMNNGVIDAVGKHEQLLETNAIYSEVFQSQHKGGAQQ